MTVLILLSNSSELDQVWQKKYQVDNEENSSAFLKKKKNSEGLAFGTSA